MKTKTSDKSKVTFYAFRPLIAWLNLASPIKTKYSLHLPCNHYITSELSCPGLKSTIAGTLSYCIFTGFLSSHNLLICVHDSLNHWGIDMVQKYSKDSTSLFLLTFLSVCLIYLKRLYPRHQSSPRFRASFNFKEPWVVRSGLKYMKGKRKKKRSSVTW